MKDLSGMQLGQYELRERLGRGGMAEVYKAYQPGMDRYVAVKLLLGHLASDEQFIERFRREAQAVGKLRHANIVNVFDFGVHDDIYYMVMDFLKGGTLKDRINKAGRLPLRDALTITTQLSSALAYAHGASMIHRDLKPANVMFDDDDASSAILTDFGIARILTASALTVSGMMVGTPAYMSPEAGHGLPADERADIYALGIILYEMLIGDVPYNADTPLAIVMKHVNAPLPQMSTLGLPEPIELIILRAMAKRPEDRYQTADELRVAVEAILPAVDDMELTAPPPQPGVASGEGLSLTAVPPIEPTPDTNQMPSPPPQAGLAPTKENDPTILEPGVKDVRGTGVRRAKPPGPAHRPVQVTDQPRRYPLTLLAGVVGVVALVLIVGLAVIGGGDSDESDEPDAAALAQTDDAATLVVEATSAVTATALAQTATAEANAASTQLAFEENATATQVAADNLNATATNDAATVAAQANAERTNQAATDAAQDEAIRAATETIDRLSTQVASQETQAAAPTVTPTMGRTQVAADTDSGVEDDPVVNGIPLLAGINPIMDSFERELMQGEPEIALQRLNVILADEPDNVDALITRSLWHSLEWDGQLALQDAARAVELAPDNPFAHLALADAHQVADTQDLESSEVAAEVAAELAPDEPEVLWRLARSAWQFGDPERALALAEAAIENGGRGFRFATMTGLILNDHGRAEEAIPYLEAAIASPSSDEGLYYDYLSALLRLDRESDAFEVALELAASPEISNFFLANLAWVAYTYGDLEQAEEWVERVLEDEPEHIEARLTEALVSRDSGEVAEAEAIFLALLDIPVYQSWPFYDLFYGHDVRLDLARLYIAEQRPDDAIAQLMAFLGEYGEYVPAWEQLGDLLVSIDDADGAYEAYLNGYDRLYGDPAQRNVATSLRQKAVALRFQTDIDVTFPETDFAFAADDTAVGLLSGLSDIHDDVDMLAWLEDEPEVAFDYLETILKDNPDDSEARSALAMLLVERFGDTETAQPHVEWLEANDPDNLVTWVALYTFATHWTVDDPDAIERALSEGLERFPEATELLWRNAQFESQEGDYAAWQEGMQRARDAGATGYRYAVVARDYFGNIGDYDYAIQAGIAAYLADTQNDYNIGQLLGLLLLNGDVGTAREFAISRQDVAAGSPYLYISLSYAVFKAEDYELAMKYALSGGALDPDSIDLSYYMQGLILGDGFGDHANAVEALRLSEHDDGHEFLNSGNGHVRRYDLARMLLAVDEAEEALSELNQVLDDDAMPWFLPAHVLRGDVWLALDAVEFARLDYDNVLLELDPSDPLYEIVSAKLEALPPADPATDERDPDFDGLPTSDETAIGTDPENFDTDGDSLSDGEEVNQFDTDPLNADTDGDEIDDGSEIYEYETDPNNPDTDGDGLTDDEEEFVHDTDALSPDTDEDGVTDGVEVAAGSDPNDASSVPANGDADDVDDATEDVDDDEDAEPEYENGDADDDDDIGEPASEADE